MWRESGAESGIAYTEGATSGWHLLCAIILAVVLLLVQTKSTSADEAGGYRMSSRVRELLLQLHDEDSESAKQAEATLRELGASDTDLDLGYLLYHPDVSAREWLAESLANPGLPGAHRLLLELTFDSVSRVRIKALDTMTGMEPHPLLARRLEELSESDDDLVRGHARLIAADWKYAAPRPPKPAKKDQRGEASPVRHVGFDNQALQRGGGSDNQDLRLPPLPSAAGGSTANENATTADAFHDALHVNEFEEFLKADERSVRPEVLDRPLDSPGEVAFSPEFEPEMGLLQTPREAPFGYTGPSSVLPSEGQQDSHFVPIEDRWRLGYPYWDRYGKGHPWEDDYPGVEGEWWDPYNQNVLKGDFPIIGQHTFLNLTASSISVAEFRQLPTPTTPFESTLNPFSEEFFGDPDQVVLQQFFRLRVDLFHGNQAAFKPLDWQVRLTPVFNMNYLDVGELGITNPDTSRGTTRSRDAVALEEWFVEAKLADLGPDYDFASMRAGSQFFVSDFRGFIFADTNRGIRLFGTRFSNRDQFNLVWFDQMEKETNSQLNTFRDRHQNVVVANYYRQDFIFPGYTAQASFHYNRDQPDIEFDKNDFLVRPDPAGVFYPHEVEAYYFGFAGDGHMGRYNINNAFYWVVGEDSMNPIGGRKQDIDAKMAALEISYDRDWARFRTSFFWASGDDDPNDQDAEGFDSILDFPNFGGEFSFWARQPIRLFGVNLVNDRSIIPDLRSSRIQGQSNFVNPGIFLFNLGFDADITPKLKAISNVNFLWFDETEVLEAFVFQDDIDRSIGTDLSLGLEFRPYHNDNLIMLLGISSLVPGDGFDDLYSKLDDDAPTMFATFLEVIATY